MRKMLFTNLFIGFKQHVNSKFNVIFTFVQNKTDLIFIALCHFNHLLYFFFN